MTDSKTMPIVVMNKIGKSFGPNKVLNDVDLSLYPGEVHSLVGENGAGKSTLIKILCGVYPKYEGSITFEENPYSVSTPLEANNRGISIIHQELSLIPSMSVVDNLFLGRPQTKLGFIKDKEQLALARTFLNRSGLDIDPSLTVERLPISVQQLVEITRALSLNAKVIVMDEPTSALNAQDAERLFNLIKELKVQRKAIVYVSHRMEEIERISDRITVLRDGNLIGSDTAEKLPMQKVISWMVGRTVSEHIPHSKIEIGSVKFQVKNAVVYDRKIIGKKLVDNVNIEVKAGEVLGIGGLQGSGNSELLMGLFGGYEKNIAEEILLNGKNIKISSPTEAINNGVALVTNDRKANGLVLSQNIVANSVAAVLRKIVKYGFRDDSIEIKLTKKMGARLKLRVPSYSSQVTALSGGNQQKVVLAKWLMAEPQVLLLDEPTRGIDIGAKHEIYELINDLKKTGIAIVLITSEMPELLALSDRIIVMHRGKVTAELQESDFTAENVIQYAMGNWR